MYFPFGIVSVCRSAPFFALRVSVSFRVTDGNSENMLSIGKNKALIVSVKDVASTVSSVCADSIVNVPVLVRRSADSVPPQPSAAPMSWQRVRMYVPFAQTMRRVWSVGVDS